MKTKAIKIGLDNIESLPTWLYITNELKILEKIFFTSMKIIIEENWRTIVTKLSGMLWNNKTKTIEFSTDYNFHQHMTTTYPLTKVLSATFLCTKS